MRKYRQVNTDGSAHRIFEGQLRVCSSDDKKNYKVKLMLLNEKVNRNNWQYTRVAEHAREAEDIPLLYSVVGNKIGNSHDFEVVTDEKGNQYASFIGAESEHPYGWLPSVVDGHPNARMETIDGVEWLTATAYLPSFYNTEMIKELEKNGGQMPISIETLVSKFHMDGDVEVEDSYTIVGVTILGVTTTPAVAGANIRKLALNEGQLKELKLRVASLVSADSNNEPQTQQNSKKGVGKSMKILNLDDIRDKFEGYTVLGCNGLSVALLSDEGRTFKYTFQENEDTVVPSRIEAVAVNSVFGEGDGAVTVSAEQLIGTEKSQLNAAKAALEKEVQKNAELTAKLNKMEEQETARRKEAVKAAIKSRLADNKRDCGYDLPDTLCDSLMTDECIGKYAGMVDEHGAFCGEKQAMCDVDALCMDEIRKENKAKAKNNGFKWSNIRDGADESGASKGVMSSLARISK